MFKEHENCLFQNEHNSVLNEDSVEENPCINRKSKSSQFSYTVVMINMKLLAVVTPPSIYHGCSTWKTVWEGKFTGKENLFLAVNLKNCGHYNGRKHKEIKDSYKHVTLDISLNFDSMYKMNITYSESEEKLER